jgi:4-hydroxy-tetrahydrodipicolinate synthase
MVARFSRVDNTVGVKDSSGDMTLTGEFIRRCGPDFAVLAGRDTMILSTLIYGGNGSIAATANVAPA